MSVDELVRRAREAMAGQRMAEALALMLRACEQAPGNAGLWLTAGTLAGQAGEAQTAETCLSKSLALHPDSASAHENLAVAMAANGKTQRALVHIEKALAMRARAGTHNRHGFLLASLGRQHEALRAYRDAIAKQPGLADAHNNMGVSLQAIGEAAPALAAYIRCCELEPERADAWNNRGLALQTLGRIEEAAEAHRHALRLDTDNAGYLSELAGTLERINQLDEARQSVDRALTLDATQPKGRLLDAVLLRREGHCETASTRLQELLESASSDRDRGEIEVELAQCLDRLGRYGEAYGHFSSGQRHLLKSWSSRPDADEYRREIEENSRWPRPAHTVEPDPRAPAFLVGFPRSGTTVTNRILDAHPDLVCSDEWPLIPRLLRHAVEDRGLSPGELDSRERDGLVAEYWRLASEYGIERDGPRLLDELPLNITRIGFIRQVFPGAPVIVALRDPRDVCLSAFMQSFVPNRAMVHFTSFADTADLYARVMRGWSEIRDDKPAGFTESRYEELVAEFEPAATRLLNHLGLEWDARVASFYRRNHGRYVSTASYQAVSEPIYDRAAGRWRNYRENIARHVDVLQPFIKQFGYE